jgi:hypothetical protein
MLLHTTVYLKKALDCEELRQEYRMSAQSCSMGFSYLIAKWLEQGCSIPASEILDIMLKSLPANLSPFFASPQMREAGGAGQEAAFLQAPGEDFQRESARDRIAPAAG